MNITETKPNGTALLSSARKAGFACFDELGFPTPQHEDWRFTNVAAIAKMTLAPVLKPAHHGIAKKR